jgi:hypothetical protein
MILILTFSLGSAAGQRRFQRVVPLAARYPVIAAQTPVIEMLAVKNALNALSPEELSGWVVTRMR